MLAIPIVRAMSDKNLFGRWFAGDTWATWTAVLKAAYCLPMTAGDLHRFRKVSGGRNPPKQRVKELWVIAGRRSGKDSVASLIAAHSAVFNDHEQRLRPGERASVICLAVDRQQARIVYRYTRSYFHQPLLAPLVINDNEETLELNNGCEIVISTNNFRSIRGKTIAAAIFDEVAYWRDDSDPRYANPAAAVYEAVVPGMATLFDDAMLIGITSPYMRSGLAYEKWERHWAHNDDDVLVVGGPSTAFNPTVPSAIISSALARDEAAARSEWLGEWRDAESAFLPVELIRAAVDVGVVTRPPEPHYHYNAFIDAAGGAGSDSFTAAIAHQQDGNAVLDAIFEATPPFKPSQAVAAIAAMCKLYRVRKIRGDRYAGEWPAESFGHHQIAYEPADRTRSEYYIDAIPLFTSGRVRLLDCKKLVDQFAGLRRRVQPLGKETIDHLPQAHDDLSNAAAGALVTCLTKKLPMQIDPAVLAQSALIHRPGPPIRQLGGSGLHDATAELQMFQRHALLAGVGR